MKYFSPPYAGGKVELELHLEPDFRLGLELALRLLLQGGFVCDVLWKHSGAFLGRCARELDGPSSWIGALPEKFPIDREEPQAMGWKFVIITLSALAFGHLLLVWANFWRREKSF